MRLSIELIDDLIKEIAGEETVPLVHYLYDKKHISEFKLADNLEITVNQVRNLLYRLDEHNLVSFIRKKDKVKGWYEYYWTFNLVKARLLIIDMKREKMSRLRKILKDEREQDYYYCPGRCLRMSGEEALEYQFTCRECDEVLLPEDTESRKKEMNEQMKKLLSDLHSALEAEEIPQDLEPKKKPQKKKVKKKISKKKHKKKFSKKKPIKKQKEKFIPKKKFVKHKEKPSPVRKKKVMKKSVHQKAPPKKGFLRKVRRGLFRR